jgi:hypothetical protein
VSEKKTVVKPIAATILQSIWNMIKIRLLEDITNNVEVKWMGLTCDEVKKKPKAYRLYKNKMDCCTWFFGVAFHSMKKGGASRFAGQTTSFFYSYAYLSEGKDL